MLLHCCTKCQSHVEEMLTIQTAIGAISPTQPVMPMSHVTRYVAFEQFVAANQVPLNSACPRNGSKATYLFYGAPFYRLPHKAPHELSLDEVDELPMGLLIPSSQMAGVKAEIYPFDTGAWSKGLYEPHLTPANSCLDDFVISSKDAPMDAAKLVTLLFGSNQEYVTGDFRAPRGSALNPVVEKVMTLHRARMLADIRRRAIEIVALEQVPWTHEGLVLIGPQHQLARRRKVVPALDALLSQSNVTVLTYIDMSPFSPTSDSRLVLEYAAKWLTQQGFLQDAP